MANVADPSSLAGIPTPLREAVRGLARFWWLWLVAGIFWTVAALVVLQFDQASITTVGVLIGILFLVSAVEQAFIGTLTPSGWKWFFYIFSVLFAAAGIISLIHPKNTFAGVADILGFLFLVVGVFWIIQAFAEKDYSSLWWLTLIAGILAVVLAFWTDGQFFVTKAYTLLIFAGVWALMHGITDLVRAFQIRSFRDV